MVAVSTSDDSKKQTNVFGVNGFRRKKKDQDDLETTEYAAGLATAVAKSQAKTFTYLMGHQLLGFEKSDGSMFFFLTDALSTVRDVVDSDGDVVASYEFSEYGQRISSSESGASSEKTFVGGLSVQDEVADTGLMLMGHRFYEPEVGRFLNRDPIGFRGGLNLFEYGRSNPVRFVDAAGLLSVEGNSQAILDFIFNLELIGGIPLGLEGDNIVAQPNKFAPWVGIFATDETRELISSLLDKSKESVNFWISKDHDSVCYGMKFNLAFQSYRVRGHGVDMADISKAKSADFIHGLGIFVHEVAEGHAEFRKTNFQYEPAHAIANQLESNFLEAFFSGGLEAEYDDRRVYSDGFEVLFKTGDSGYTVPDGFRARR